jgi:glycosyltransferase involved in cell wall biosynthesis
MNPEIMSTHKKKVICVISAVDYSLGFLWVGRGFKNSSIDYEFIFLAPTEPSLHLQFLEEQIESRYITCRSKADYPGVLFKLWKHFIQKRPDIVHAQLIEAGLLGLTAAMLAGIHNRIYTRHHATYNKIYYPHMVKYDRYINHISTQIVAISGNVAKVLKEDEKVAGNKITVIPHGFELTSFLHPPFEEVYKLKSDYNPNGKKPVIGVISRFIELKGIQYIVPAFKKFLKAEPDALLILANAHGNYKTEIETLLETLPDNSYKTIGFEKNLFALYKLFDYFIHVPIDASVEAYGQVYVEAPAAGIPCIFTLSGIANDFIKDQGNAMVVPFKDTNAIYDALIKLHQQPELREKLIQNGLKDVQLYFTFEESLKRLIKLYDN